MEEVEDASKLKNGKAAGVDGLLREFLKKMGKKVNYN